MSESNASGFVVIGCEELDPTVVFLTGLGFRVDAVFPADAPAITRLSGFGLVLELRRGQYSAARLRLATDSLPAGELVAPNGTIVEVSPATSQLRVPPAAPSVTITRCGGEAGVGRAGMRYRDLLPDRWGGRFIASHISVPGSGPVPDYVHYHHVRFQMIFVARGWVRLVYEDQGEPFTMVAGDCVLQPPLIRHRVLESGDDLEVIEIGCPAEHETLVEHGFDLPTPTLDPRRDFDGQLFVRHVAAEATDEPWTTEGWRCRDTGISMATRGLASACVVRGSTTAAEVVPSGELWFAFMLNGSLQLTVDGREHRLRRDDAFAIPAGTAITLADAGDAELLVLTMP